MSNVLEPQITETKSSLFSEFIKNNPNWIETIGINPNAMVKPAVMPNNGEPYVFLKDFSFKKQIFEGGSPSDLSIGAKLITENYKKDQVVYPFPSSPNVRMMPNPAFTKAINEGVLVPQKTAQQQAQMEIAQQKPISDVQKNNTKEPIYYILVTVGVMIAGYFAYNKFKK
jgi:hypothetical protein